MTIDLDPIEFRNKSRSADRAKHRNRFLGWLAGAFAVYLVLMQYEGMHRGPLLFIMAVLCIRAGKHYGDWTRPAPGEPENGIFPPALQGWATAILCAAVAYFVWVEATAPVVL